MSSDRNRIKPISTKGRFVWTASISKISSISPFVPICYGDTKKAVKLAMEEKLIEILLPHERGIAQVNYEAHVLHTVRDFENE